MSGGLTRFPGRPKSEWWWPYHNDVRSGWPGHATCALEVRGLGMWTTLLASVSGQRARRLVVGEDLRGRRDGVPLSELGVWLRVDVGAADACRSDMGCSCPASLRFAAVMTRMYRQGSRCGGSGTVPLRRPAAVICRRKMSRSRRSSPAGHVSPA